MLQNTLLNVKLNLEKACLINDKRIDKLINNMKFWEFDKIVYPSQIKSLLFISYKQTYELLTFIKDLGILEYNYEIYCSKCEKFLDRPALQSLNEFPKDFYCDENHKLSPLNDTILVFRVICNE